jgi:hypothetical protein
MIVAATEPGEGGIREWLADEVLQRMMTLRDSADPVGAHEALFLLKAAGASRLVDVDAAGADNEVIDHKIVYRDWISCLPHSRPEVLNDLH